MSELLNLVDQLTKTHKKAIHTIDGVEFHDRPALLEQLREAVFGGMERSGGSALKSKLPISDAAVDLYQLIDQQIAEAWSQVHGRPPGVSTPERMITEWAAAVDEAAVIVVTRPETGRAGVFRANEEWLPAQLAGKWVGMVEDFLDPERTAEIKAPCLQCGAEKVRRFRDGELMESWAMVFRRDRVTGETLDARCTVCGHVWLPDRFEFLANAIGVVWQQAS